MEETPKDPPLFSVITSGDIVTIEVGPDHRKHYIYKALLTHYSEYFRKALKEPWKEADRGGITVLDDVEPGVFNFFVQWLFTQKFPTNNADWIALAEESAKVKSGEDYDMLLVKLYIFADRFGIPELQNRANNHLVWNFIGAETSVWHEMIIHAFENIPANREILQAIVDARCACWEDEDDGPGGREMLPRDFLLRTSLRYKDLINGKASDELQAWDYYEFSSEAEKAAWKVWLEDRGED